MPPALILCLSLFGCPSEEHMREFRRLVESDPDPLARWRARSSSPGLRAERDLQREQEEYRRVRLADEQFLKDLGEYLADSPKGLSPETMKLYRQVVEKCRARVAEMYEEEIEVLRVLHPKLAPLPREKKK